MHICGNNSACIPHFNKIEKLRGLEVNFNYLDVFEVADLLRDDIVLICTGSADRPLLTELGDKTLKRFATNEFPDRKMLFFFNGPANNDKIKWLLDIVKG